MSIVDGSNAIHLREEGRAESICQDAKCRPALSDGHIVGMSFPCLGGMALFRTKVGDGLPSSSLEKDDL